MRITFYGAAQNVTGSKHLIESQGFRLLLDCGMFQGHRKESLTKNSKLPFEPKSINAVILSHSHADHCGMLPILVREGFRGSIYSTPATRDITELILKDSAHIQAQDAMYINRHLEPDQDSIEPLYNEADVINCMKHFLPVPYFRDSKTWTRIAPHIRFKLYDAGHILGSSVILLEIEEGDAIKTLLFTGDLGSRNVPLLRNPDPIDEPTQTVISECTYGGHNHRPIGDAKIELEKVVRFAIKYKSKIIVPAFSLGRTQELIYILHKLTDDNKIPPIPIYIDSPLAGDLKNVYSEYQKAFDTETWKDFGSRGEMPFIFSNLKYTKTIEESKRLNELRGPCMIISASGMAEGGRIVHHLKHNLSNPNNIVVFTGYQAEGTLGRKILEGVNPVYIHNQPIEVRATVVTVNELSAHADQNELLQYLTELHETERIFLVHTELSRAEEFKEHIQDKFPNVQINIPASNAEVEI